MANLQTHLQYAAAGSGIGATLLLNADILNAQEALLCWITGTLGGIILNVDTDDNQSLGLLFGLLSVTLSAVTVVSTIDQWPLVWVWLSAAATFLLIQYGLRYALKAFSKYRGSYRSILSALLLGLSVTAIANFTGAESTASWFFGLFFFAGFVIHLLMNEIFAIVAPGAGNKRSIGSSFKFFDYRNLKVSALVTVLTIGVFFLTPSSGEFREILRDQDTYSDIMASITPERK